MATYAELKTALGSTELLGKIEVAIRIVTDKVSRGDDTGGGFNPANHADRLIWAVRVLQDPEGITIEALRHFQLLVAAQRTETLATILALNDAEVQSLVEEGVDLFAG